MNILHLGAFRGNVGDLFSHTAFQDLVRTRIDPLADFTEVELREFYKNANLRKFDNDFLREINDHDLFVVGGGQFFDVRWNYSDTGTTLNFSKKFIDAIERPVIFNGVGYAEPREGTLPETEISEIFDKFRNFIEYLSHKEWLLTLRNDGSYERIKHRFGKKVADVFSVVPDNGFYFDKMIEPYRFNEHSPTIGINIANDQFEQAFSTRSFVEELNRQIALAIQDLVERGYRILLIPHMPKDLEAVYALYRLLGEKFFRFNICIAPYNPQDENAARQMVAYYKACDTVLAMRFHANVIAIENCIPSVGLAVEGFVSRERIQAIYKTMGLGKFCLSLVQEDGNIAKRIVEAVLSTEKKANDYRKAAKKAMSEVEDEKQKYTTLIKAYLSR